MSSWSADIL